MEIYTPNMERERGKSLRRTRVSSDVGNNEGRAGELKLSRENVRELLVSLTLRVERMSGLHSTKDGLVERHGVADLLSLHYQLSLQRGDGKSLLHRSAVSNLLLSHRYREKSKTERKRKSRDREQRKRFVRKKENGNGVCEEQSRDPGEIFIWKRRSGIVL